MDKFYLSFFNLANTGYYYNKERDTFNHRLKEFRELAKYLNHFHLQGRVCQVKVEPKEVIQIETSEISFILTFLEVFSKYCGKVWNDEKDQYFVLGNSHYAFSNNQKLTCYVPDLKRAFRSESFAVSNMTGDASTSSILKMTHCTLDELKEWIAGGEIRVAHLWSPFDEPKFFETSDYVTNQSRKQKYNELLSKREESKQVFVDKLLNCVEDKTGSNSFCSSIICSDANGMSVIIDPSKIAAIIPESNPWDLITAKVVIPNDTVIRVDLCSFVKVLTRFELINYHLPETLIEQSVDDDLIPDFKEAMDSAKEIIEVFFSKANEEQESVQQINAITYGDEEDEVFTGDFDEN